MKVNVIKLFERCMKNHGKTQQPTENRVMVTLRAYAGLHIADRRIGGACKL